MMATELRILEILRLRFRSSYNAHRTFYIYDSTQDQHGTDLEGHYLNADVNQPAAFTGRICSKLPRWRRDNWCLNLRPSRPVRDLLDLRRFTNRYLGDIPLALKNCFEQELHSTEPQKDVLYFTY